MFRFRGFSARIGQSMRIPSLVLLFAIAPAVVSADDAVWRLAVINGGTLRGAAVEDAGRLSVVPVSSRLGEIFAAPHTRAAWSLQLGMVRPPHVHRTSFGMAGGLPIAGDFNGDGFAELGMFVAGRWFIDMNANNVWDDGDLLLTFGTNGDLPVVGDWDQDGKADIGVVSLSAAGDTPTGRDVRTFRFGAAGDVPVVGDWDGTGVDRIGVFRNGEWRLDIDGDGQFTARDLVVQLGQSGDKPIVGDFNRDGRDDLGVYRNGAWIIDTSGDRRFTSDDLRLTLGGFGDLPVVGDWDGDGRDQVGLLHR